MKERSAPRSWAAQMRRAMGFLRPHLGWVLAILALILAGAAANAVHPLVHKYIFDGLTEGAAWRQVLLGISALFALGLFGELMSGLSNWMMWRTRLRLNEDLLDATIAKLYRLPLSFHKDETVGGLMTRTERGINGFLAALTEIAFGILPAAAYLILAGYFMARLEWRLSLVVLGGAVLVAAISAWATGPQTRRDRALLERWTRINGRFNEALAGILTLKSMVLEESERGRFLRGARNANRLVLRGVGFDTSVNAAKNTGALAARVTALGLGAWLVLRGEITVGTLVAFVGYLAGIFGPVFGLTGTYAALRRAAVSLDAVYSILDAPERRSAAAVRPAAPLRGLVEFDDVTFSYESTPVLRGISFRAEPGEHIAIVGPSGAGKTTLVALLQKFYEPTEGAIRLDGVDAAELDDRSIRRQIGVVLQETFLFRATIMDNIRAARPEASRADVERAARASRAHEFIERLPLGYDTIVGERGGSLSGGQRQRVAIARALLKDPPVLILDEATSALDPESQAALREALPRLAHGRTTFLISHRLSMVAGSDRILVMKDGRIVESGTHAELIEHGGTYARLVRLQHPLSLRPTLEDAWRGDPSEGVGGD